jgi:uncharacterized protein YukJ
VWDAVVATNIQPWTNATGNAAGNAAGHALIAMDTHSPRIFALGAPYTEGLGVHDVHCNPGDPPGQFRPLDGIWQDGCVFAFLP